MKQFHEVANIFPLMQGDEFEQLKADIAENGQHEPIWLHPDGSIIDGRNRYRACMALGIEPDYRTWDGDGSLVSFVVSLNLHRRHLSSIQRAGVVVDILPMLEAEAKERQAHGQTAPGKTLPENFPEAFELFEEVTDTGETVQGVSVKFSGESRDAAAAIVGTNGRYVADMKRYQEQAPEVFEMAKAGEINGSQAQELAKISATRRAQVLQRMKESGETKVRKVLRAVVQDEKRNNPPPPIEGKYRVWYADPPWSYGNSGVITDNDAYGRAERHYPTMTIAELCAMGKDIRQACEDDAVLFLWVTSPLLEDAFDVIRAWGFKYKSSFVWDKVKHNFAHYNSMRHEFLLICTRGSCTPDVPQLINSVQRIERSDRHSEKPQEFRQIIETLYTHGNMIELFARQPADGWEAWGNEVE